jgi:4-alpha-glucanotransferase
VADSAIHPLQDVLALPTECRMNYPGQSDGWWQWRFQWPQLQPWHAERLAELVRLYGR